MPRKYSKPKNSAKAAKAGTEHSFTAPPAKAHSDVAKIDGIRVMRPGSAESLPVSAPMLHEGFPGGEEARQRLHQASKRMRMFTRRKGEKPVPTANDKLGIETERAHFAFAKIIHESRALKDKGLHVKASGNLEHARKILDEINEKRARFGLSSLSAKELLSFQRPLTTIEAIQLIRQKVERQKKRYVRRKLLRSIEKPREKIVNVLRTRVNQLSQAREEERVLLKKRELASLLKIPAQQIVAVLRGRTERLAGKERENDGSMETKNISRKSDTKTVSVSMEKMEWDEQLRRRFDTLPKDKQRALRELLDIGAKAGNYYFQTMKKGDLPRAKKSMSTMNQAMQTFWEMLLENP